MNPVLQILQLLDKIEPEPDDPPAVDLIAAGYEWICPDASCYAHNTTFEASEVVTCRLCKTSYTTNPPEHALP